MPLDWTALVAQMSNVQKLVHLAMRRDPLDEDRIRTELLQQRRRAYEDELMIQAARVGCPGRSARLENGAVLTALNEMCERDAVSIANTYNYRLGGAIRRIFEEVPTANRHVYAKRLQVWEAERDEWKVYQIAEYTEGSTRAIAQSDFYRFNGAFGTAVLEPVEAVCPVCQGWVARGEVPLREATNNPPPYHPNCPHGWRTMPERVAEEDCPLLWMGE